MQLNEQIDRERTRARCLKIEQIQKHSQLTIEHILETDSHNEAIAA